MGDRSRWWWVTTVLGAVGAACVAAGPQIGGEIGTILVTIGGALAAVLGITHPGRIT